MSLTRNPLNKHSLTVHNQLRVSIDGIAIYALIDTGAAISIMREDLRQRLHKVLTPPDSTSLRGADGHLISSLGMCGARIALEDKKTFVLFTVIQTCPHALILGWDFLSAHAALIDCATENIELDVSSPDEPQPVVLKLCSVETCRIPPLLAVPVKVSSNSPLVDGDYIVSPSMDVLFTKQLSVAHSIVSVLNGSTSLWVVNISQNPQLLASGTSLAITSPLFSGTLSVNAVDQQHDRPGSPPISDLNKITAMIDSGLDTTRKHQIQNLLLRYRDVFDLGSRPLGRTTAIKHQINTGTHPPLHRSPYRVSRSERRIIQTEVDKMIAQDIVQPSSSPWSSPVVLVKKKDGSWRFCVDYRQLNKITKRDVYPLPRIDDTLDSLHGANYFSTIDLRSGYWQISVDDSDREKTAFITPDGLYEFKVMPFGLCNAPATFERMIDRLLKPLRWTTCLCYLDDVIIFSDSFSSHLERLDHVLNIFKQANLQLNSSKCHFAASELKILGHLVNMHGIQPDPDKTKAVQEFPTPQSPKDVRSFLGLCSYFRRFIYQFAHIAQPLTQLLKKNQPFLWKTEQDVAFTRLKDALTTSPILGHFDDSAPTELRTDASGHGIGAILAQQQSGQECIIAYASRTLSPAEQNYTITERECLAVVWSIAKFRPYLFGRQFSVITDHHALCWLSSLRDPIGRLGRWALRLQEYDFKVIYKSGKLHRDADCLSRHPVGPVDQTADNSDIPILHVSHWPNIADEQRRDLFLKKIIEAVTTDANSPSSRYYTIQNHILYRHNFRQEGPSLLLVIPKHLQSTVLGELHDAPSAGHMGVLRTYARVKQRFYWPDMYRTVKRYISSCDSCQRRKTPPLRPAGLLHPLTPPASPFDRVGIDLLGPFPTSSLDNRWIAVAIDYATRYAITKPLYSSTAVDVAQFILEEVILKYGAPRQLLSDRGRPFVSRIVAEILNLCSVVHKKTTAYHPQTNGLVERINRTLADMLAMYISADHRNWDSVLPFITFAYNSSRHDTTGFSPYYLLFSREPNLIIDTLLPVPTNAELTDHTTQAICRAEEARQLARLRTLDSQQHQSVRYNESHRSAYYSPGDLVLVWTPKRHVGLAQKLLPRYSGPYRVLARRSDLTYLVQPVQPPQNSRQSSADTVHITRLKPYLLPPNGETPLSPGGG